MRHILITYSWSMSNIGDMAISPGLLHLLKRHLPDCPRVLVTSQNAAEPEHQRARDYLTARFPDLRVIANPFAALVSPGAKSATRQKLLARWPGEAETFERGTVPAHKVEAMVNYLLDDLAADILDELTQVAPETRTAFERAGFVLYASGTVLNFGRAGRRHFWKRLLPYLLPLILARKLGIPYGIFSHSFEAVEWPVNVLYRRLFADAAFIGCRDGDSLEYLQQQGITNPQMSFCPDSSFFFAAEDDGWAEKFLAHRWLEPKKFITVTIRTSAQPGPLAGVMPPEREAQHMKRVREFVDGWVGATGLPVLLCPEVRHEIEAAKLFIYDQLPASVRARTVWMDHFWLTEQAKAVFRRARIVVSMEQHSVILALAAGTPALLPQFAEAGRKAWMLKDLGVEDWLFDIDHLQGDELRQAALAIHTRYPEAVTRVRQAIDKLEAAAAEVLGKANRLRLQD